MLRYSFLALLIFSTAAFGQPAKLPTPQEMAASREDLWGEAAIRHPDGPSYEFFKDLLPPLRYVNTAFRHYPIVLSAPADPTGSAGYGTCGILNGLSGSTSLASAQCCHSPASFLTRSGWAAAKSCSSLRSASKS